MRTINGQTAEELRDRGIDVKELSKDEQLIYYYDFMLLFDECERLRNQNEDLRNIKKVLEKENKRLSNTNSC